MIMRQRLVASEPERTAAARRQRLLMLAMATVGFAINFWAWALISPSNYAAVRRRPSRRFGLGVGPAA